MTELETSISKPLAPLAYRAWALTLQHSYTDVNTLTYEKDKAGRVILRSTGMRSAWRESTLKADCSRCADEPPNLDCVCGIYCLKEPSLIKERVLSAKQRWIETFTSVDSYNSDGKDVYLPGYLMYIFGTVIFWGKVIEGADGYRVQYAKIENLLLPPVSIHPSRIEHLNFYCGKHNKLEGIPFPPIDNEQLKEELSKSYGVPVFEDTRLLYYWKMSEPLEYQAQNTIRGHGCGKPSHSWIPKQVRYIIRSRLLAWQ